MTVDIMRKLTMESDGMVEIDAHDGWTLYVISTDDGVHVGRDITGPHVHVPVEDIPELIEALQIRHNVWFDVTEAGNA